MSGRDDWAPGDLALCVDDRPRWAGYPLPVRRGGLYTVASVYSDFDEIWGFESALRLLGIESVYGFAVPRFIKVTPPEADEFDRETIALEQRKTEEVS